MGTPSNHLIGSNMRLTLVPATGDHKSIAKMHIHAKIEMARQWVVAESRAEFNAIHSEITSEKC